MHTTEALIPHIKLDLIQTLAIAGIVYLTGMMLKRKINILERLNIPSAVLGGLLFAVFNLLSHDRVLNQFQYFHAIIVHDAFFYFNWN